MPFLNSKKQTNCIYIKTRKQSQADSEPGLSCINICSETKVYSSDMEKSIELKLLKSYCGAGLFTQVFKQALQNRKCYSRYKQQ